MDARAAQFTADRNRLHTDYLANSKVMDLARNGNCIGLQSEKEGMRAFLLWFFALCLTLPAAAQTVYSNGPINGNTDAWTVDFGFITSDTFNVSNNGTTVTGLSFGAWLSPGDTLNSIEVSITSGENGGTSYFDETLTNWTASGCVMNQFGYDVCTESATFNGPTLNNGTYWLNLQDANSPFGDPIYWDENSGPSAASENSIGSIPSESFTVFGSHHQHHDDHWHRP